MSHWRVDDKASSILMDYFYKYLASGEPKDHAQRLAKLDYLENSHPANSHPFSWGAFAMVGDVTPLNAPKRWCLQWWIYVTVISLFVLIVIFFQ